MKKIILGFLSLLFVSFHTIGQTFDVDTLVLNGNINKYINLVYLGDGYTISEQSKFITDAQTINIDFFDRTPYKEYKNFFNVIAIKVISAESGVKHPRTTTDCPSASEFPYQNPNNYFGTSFDYGSYYHRLVYPSNSSLVYSVLGDNFPLYDQVLMIANTNQYGGAGGAFAVGTANIYSVEIMLHECGHSFVGLADEYWAGDVYAAEKPNLTNSDFATSSLVKWQNWLGVDGTGIYEHCCGGISSDWYKPHTNCQMEYLEREFCPVCRQHTIQKIYELVSPIVAYTPSSSLVSIPEGENMDFKLTELIRPEPNTLKREWFLNGVSINLNTDSIRLLSSQLISGANELKVIVTDTNYMLRVAPSYTHHINTVTWTINSTTSTFDIDDYQTHLTAKVYPNPAKELLQVEIKGFNLSETKCQLIIYDVQGRIVTKHDSSINFGNLEEKLSIQSLPEGNYILEIKTENIREQLKFTKSK